MSLKVLEALHRGSLMREVSEANLHTPERGEPSQCTEPWFPIPNSVLYLDEFRGD